MFYILNNDVYQEVFNKLAKKAWVNNKVEILYQPGFGAFIMEENKQRMVYSKSQFACVLNTISESLKSIE